MMIVKLQIKPQLMKCARGGRGRFFVDAKPTQGLLLVGKEKGAIELMERLQMNQFLKRATKALTLRNASLRKLLIS